MRTGLAATLAAAFLLLAGCSQTKTVSVLGTRWEAGQHQDCIYKAEGLYCIPASMRLDAGMPREELQDKDGKPVPRSEMLFLRSVDLTQMLDKHRSEAQQDKYAETGTYDAKFSAKPVEYSVWDCLKTGAGSPAISCTLTRKPSGDKDDKFIAQQEEDAKLNDTLSSLSQDQLQAKCGKPAETTSDVISRSLIYNSGAGVRISFRFSTYQGSDPRLDTAESEKTKDAKPAQRIFWTKGARTNMREAGLLGQDMPCLKQ